jgi:hypothetical protein
MVGRDKVGGETSAAGMTAAALVALALGLGLGCASDPPADDDDRSNTPGAAGSMASNLPSTGAGMGVTNKPPTTGGATPPAGSAGMAGGSTPVMGGAGTTSTMAGSGSGMTGGMVNCGALALPMNADDVVSTFEDGTGNVNQTAGRGGGFYMFNDMTAGAMQTPPPGMLPEARKVARCDGMFALCMAGKGFTTWGAGMGTDLGPTGTGDGGVGSKNPYDASVYKGVQFWAKANPGSALQVRVNFKDKNTAPEGGVCNAAESSGPEACNDDWGKNLTLTMEWAPYTILWADLRQSGWGKASSAYDTKNAFSIQFQVNKGLDFDLCIDDLAFVR